jgi:hypothetical protein
VAAIAFARILPLGVGYEPAERFADRVDATLPDREKVYLVDMPEAQITYYIDQPVERIDSLKELPAKLKFDDDGDAYVIAEQADVERLAQFGSVEEVDHLDPLLRRQTEEDRLLLLRVRPRMR